MRFFFVKIPWNLLGEETQKMRIQLKLTRSLKKMKKNCIKMELLNHPRKRVTETFLICRALNQVIRTMNREHFTLKKMCEFLAIYTLYMYSCSSCGFLIELIRTHNFHFIRCNMWENLGKLFHYKTDFKQRLISFSSKKSDFFFTPKHFMLLHMFLFFFIAEKWF